MKDFCNQLTGIHTPNVIMCAASHCCPVHCPGRGAVVSSSLPPLPAVLPERASRATGFTSGHGVARMPRSEESAGWVPRHSGFAAKRMARIRAHETPEETADRRARAARAMAWTRANETPEQAAERRARCAQRMAEARARETQEQAAARRARSAQRMAEARARETPEQTARRRARNAEAMARARATQGAEGARPVARRPRKGKGAAGGGTESTKSGSDGAFWFPVAIFRDESLTDIPYT